MPEQLDHAFADANHPISEDIANELEAQIFSGKLKPGDRLVERQLAQDFNVSRQPVRDALKLLMRHGLISQLPTRGVAVASLRPKELNDLFVVRESLEALAARLACQNVANGADPTRLKRLLDENKRAILARDNETAFRTNAEFHEEVLALADNKMLTDILNPILMRMHRLSGDKLDLSTVHAEHVDLYEAITSGDLKIADMSARNHTSSYKDRTRKKLSEGDEDATSS